MSQIAARNWTLLHSPPPYDELLALPDPPRCPRSYSLLVLVIDTLTRDDLARNLRELVGELRRGFIMPVFVRCDLSRGQPSIPDFRDAVIAAGAELLPPGQSVYSRARDVLTARRDLAADWVGWLRLHCEVGPRQEEIIRTIIAHSGSERSAEKTLVAAGISGRTARWCLAQAVLPPPGMWHRGSRILRALLRLQRDPTLFVFDVAVELGYSGSDTFSNQMFRYFRHGADKGRGWLGLERRFHHFHEYASRGRP